MEPRTGVPLSEWAALPWRDPVRLAAMRVLARAAGYRIQPLDGTHGGPRVSAAADAGAGSQPGAGDLAAGVGFACELAAPAGARIDVLPVDVRLPASVWSPPRPAPLTGARRRRPGCICTAASTAGRRC
jgi:hypothetical protein